MGMEKRMDVREEKEKIGISSHKYIIEQHETCLSKQLQ